jgi:hypothetical protein
MVIPALSAISASPVDLPLMPSSTAPFLMSPITQFSYDVLLEIFTHCLPQYPLYQRQPSAKTAPILLCHICSALRCTLALPVWQTLIRALPRLRWGHFDLITGSAPFGVTAGAPPPPECTLPDFRTQSLVVHCTVPSPPGPCSRSAFCSWSSICPPSAPSWCPPRA